APPVPGMSTMVVPPAPEVPVVWPLSPLAPPGLLSELLPQESAASDAMKRPKECRSMNFLRAHDTGVARTLAEEVGHACALWARRGATSSSHWSALACWSTMRSMHAVYFDDPCADDVRRQRLYDGEIFVYSPRPASLAFCKFAREMIEEAFAPLDPETAQHQMPVEQFAEILGRLKPSFIHHQESKRHLGQVLSELGCDLDKTYFDVPKMRSST